MRIPWRACVVCHHRGRVVPPWVIVSPFDAALTRWVCSEVCRVEWAAWQVCAVCGVPASPRYRALCHMHYQAIWRRQRGITAQPWRAHCQQCGAPRGKRGLRLGLCGACYERARRAQGAPLRACAACGRQTRWVARRWCARCYSAWQRAQKREAVA